MLRNSKIITDGRGVILKGTAAVVFLVIVAVVLLFSLAQGDTESAAGLGTILAGSVILTFLGWIWNRFRSTK